MSKLLAEGDIIELAVGHAVNAQMQGRASAVRIDYTNELAGIYVVYKTAMDGGGSGHGRHDTYPNGHHVYCERWDNPAIKVDFYQTGCFLAKIEPIAPVGKAARRWLRIE